MSATCADPPITSTFLQPTYQFSQLSTAELHRQFSELRVLGIRRMYLQWTQHQDYDVLSATTGSGVTLLRNILDAGAASGIKLYVGLEAHPDFSQRIQQSPASVEVYLRRLRRTELQQARRIWEVARNHPAFSGWYIADEIDDRHWHGPVRQQILAQHLSDLVTSLRAVAPLEVAISTYIGGYVDPRGFGSMWSYVWRDPDLKVLLQDGAGTRSVPPEDFTAYLRAFAAAARQRSWGVIIELFDQKHGPPVDNQPFHAVPAEARRTFDQIAAARAYAKAELSSFSMTDYMLANTATAQPLQRAYLAKYCGAAAGQPKNHAKAAPKDSR